MSSILGLALPKDYGYVVIATSATFFLGWWHGLRITSFRRSAGIGYPKAYADSSDLSSADAETKKKMYLFNCAQRSHGNYLENQPSVIAAMLIAGLRYPQTTAALGVAWMAGRLVYAIGYTSQDRNDGKGRLYGSFFWLAQLGLFGLSGWTGYKML